MAGYSWATCPEPVRSQVIGLVDDLREVLGDNLVGVYLHGSLAMGCFNPERSDLDLLAITRKAMEKTTKRRVAELLLRYSTSPRPVEISFISQEDIHPWRHPAPYEFHYGEGWREGFEGQLSQGAREAWLPGDDGKVLTDVDLAAHVTVTLSRGICLHGKPAREVLPDVPEEHFVKAIVEDFYWGRERLEENPIYFVLTACRVYGYLLTGKVMSKEEGGMWALGTLRTDWHGLVAQALELYRGGNGEEQLDVAAVDGFAAYMEGELEKALEERDATGV